MALSSGGWSRAGEGCEVKVGGAIAKGEESGPRRERMRRNEARAMRGVSEGEERERSVWTGCRQLKVRGEK